MKLIKRQLQNTANTYLKQLKVELCISYCDNNSSAWCVWNYFDLKQILIYIGIFCLLYMTKYRILCCVDSLEASVFYKLNAVIALNVCLTLLYTFSNITAQTLPDGIFLMYF